MEHIEWDGFLFERESANRFWTLTKLLMPRDCLQIPDYVQGFPVEAIGSNAFYDCDGISHIILPSTLNKIGSSAFAKSTIQSIQRIINVKSLCLYVDRFAFAQCCRLVSVQFGGATFLEQSGYQFKDCINLRSIDSKFIRGGIPMGAFENCDLHKFSFSDGVIVRTRAFYNVPLKEIYVPSLAKIAGDFWKGKESMQIFCDEGNPVAELAYSGFNVEFTS